MQISGKVQPTRLQIYSPVRSRLQNRGTVQIRRKLHPWRQLQVFSLFFRESSDAIDTTEASTNEPSDETGETAMADPSTAAARTSGDNPNVETVGSLKKLALRTSEAAAGVKREDIH